MDAWTGGRGGYVSSVDEVREKTGKPISGSILLDEINTVGVRGAVNERLTSGRVEGLRAERGSLGDMGVRGGRGEGGGRWTSIDAGAS